MGNFEFVPLLHSVERHDRESH